MVDKAILVMLSGGLDSTYVLYKYLRETDLPVHAHHISMMMKTEARWVEENRATQSVLEYCQRYRHFTASDSTFEFPYPYMGWDTDVQLLIGARMAANLDAKSVVVTLGINADDLQRPEIIERNNRNVLTNLWKAARESIDAEHREKIHPTIHLPFKDVPKWKMMLEMPEELITLTWSCRSPTFSGAPCGTCHACRARNQADEMRRSHLDQLALVDDTIRI